MIIYINERLVFKIDGKKMSWPRRVRRACNESILHFQFPPTGILPNVYVHCGLFSLFVRYCERYLQETSGYLT